MITTGTMQAIDAWILLATAIWFLPKGLLFLATAIMSWRLTPRSHRTRLGDAYRMMFGGLSLFSFLMGVLFYARWTAGPPSEVTMAIWIAMVTRMVLVVVIVFVTATELWVTRELVKRVRARRFPDLDGTGPPPAPHDLESRAW